MGGYLWTRKEIRIMMNHYESLPNKEMQKLLPRRTEQTIMTKAQMLGLMKRRSPIKWTRRQIKYLIKNYPAKSPAELSRIIGYPRHTVAGKIYKLKKGGKISGSRVQPWTERDMKKLEKYLKGNVLDYRKLERMFKDRSTIALWNRVEKKFSHLAERPWGMYGDDNKIVLRCLRCGTTDSFHASKGYCFECFKKVYYQLFVKPKRLSAGKARNKMSRGMRAKLQRT